MSIYSEGFRTPDPQRNVMGQSTDMPPLVSTPCQAFLKHLEFFYENFNNSMYVYNTF